ncbi:hypothetical protein B0J13DRAFT_461177 [Dactylonectria estremocensis]|uniref:Chromo domain-containing protein n=1 Tax=Dactylonectria estremocensis TaxID=1079267 RepID=A0A9P9D3E0_9HYPO|nr:hypothetical protein B0J13DRAFT_461177 [Dactylonectria estremocensis]
MDVDEEHETDSITSTIEEEPDSDQEWLVNDILAEGKDATGTTKYLIDWQGYPLYDASWEPKENLGDTMLADWEESKKNEGHQRKSNDSINAWYKAVIARLHGKIARHDERNRRREELGLDVSIYEKSLEDCLEDLKKHPKAQVMEDEKTTASRSNKNQPRIQREPSGNVTQRQHGTYEDQVLKTIRPKPPTRGFSDPDVAKPRSGAAAGVHRVVHKPMTKTSLMSKLGHRKYTGPPKEQNSGTTSLPSVAREASSGNSSNVFVGGTTRKKKGTLLDAATDPNKAPQFLKSRLINKIQKGLRDKEGTVTPAKQPLSVFNLNPAERQRVDQKVKFGRDSIASSTQEDMQTEDPPHQPNSDEHTMRESEKGSSTVEKKKKKKKKSVRWGDGPEVPPQTNPGSESSLFIEPLTASPEIEQQTVQPKEENGEQSTTILNLLPTASMMTASPPPVEGGFCPSIQTITKRAKFGPSATASIPLTFEGPSGENMHPWLSMLAGPEPLTFTHTCIAQDFWSQTASKPLFRGIVTSCDNLASLTSTSERLKLGSFGATGFLEASSLAPIPLSLDHGNEDFPPGMPLALFRRIFGIEYARVLPERLQNTARHSFFLAFPRSATVDAMFLARWLRICNSDCQIYSSHFPGHWQYFMNIEAGVVIIDEDAAHSIRKFPHINHLLSTNPERFTFWVFTKSLRTLTLLPHESNSFAEIGAIRLQSALEFGTAILVPPSFLVSQPRQALVLFRWLWQSNVKASIDRYRRARVVVCARIDEWLFELAVESSKRTPSQPSTTVQIHIRGAAQHSQAIEAMFQTWKFVKKLIDEPIDPSPLIFAPEFIDGNDEQSLVNWFGWWSSMNMGQFRRFIVLGTETESARLSRCIKRPRFLPSTTNSLDEMHLHHDREEHLKYLTSLHGKIAQPIVLDQSRMSLDNQSRVLVNAIDAVIRNAHRRCPLEIFKFPVSYWDGDMAYHFGDYKSLFATYSKCSNWHHPFDALSHPVRNTMTALFYTIEGPWDVNLYPGGKMPTRRPWLVMHRPVNVSRRPWRASELLIWDPTPNEKFSLGDVYEDDLIEAQREMIRFFHQQNAAKNPDQPLKRVWIAGFDSSSIDSNADLLLEETLFTLQKFVDDPRIWLPALDTDLPVRGWKIVKSGSAPTTLSPQSPPVDAMDIDEPEDAGAENGQTMVTIFHPPRGANVVLGSTKCCNRLYQCTIESYQQVRADVEHRMEYTFRPTQVWYREQLMEGRGFEHVQVSPWHATFNRFCLPTDME